MICERTSARQRILPTYGKTGSREDGIEERTRKTHNKGRVSERERKGSMLLLGQSKLPPGGGAVFFSVAPEGNDDVPRRLLERDRPTKNRVRRSSPPTARAPQLLTTAAYGARLHYQCSVP